MKIEKTVKQGMLQNIEVASYFILKYIISDEISIKDFCDSNKINKKEFNNYVEKVKKYNPNVYKAYIKKKNNINEESIKNINKIKEMIIKGIEKNNEIREFELFDYLNITTLSLSDFYQLIESDLTSEELKVIKRFILKNIDILKEKRPLSKTRSKLIFTIDDIKIESTKEDDKEVKDYLKQHNIPVIDVLYVQAMKRHLENKVYKKQLTVNNK